MLVMRLAKTDDEATVAVEEPGAVEVGAVVAVVAKVEAVVARAVVAGVTAAADDVAAVDDVATAAARDAGGVVMAASVKVKADCRGCHLRAPRFGAQGSPGPQVYLPGLKPRPTSVPTGAEEPRPRVAETS
jgi:hypothetical protein